MPLETIHVVFESTYDHLCNCTMLQPYLEVQLQRVNRFPIRCISCTVMTDFVFSYQNTDCSLLCSCHFALCGTTYNTTVNIIVLYVLTLFLGRDDKISQVNNNTHFPCIIIIITSVLPKGRSFTINSNTKAAILPKGRSSIANSGT